MMEVIAISGGMDPVHIGHLEMLERANEIAQDEGDLGVLVILNSDAWLMRKKGYVFMPFSERRAILEAFYMVDRVVEVDDSDGTVCEALKRYQPKIFANGGDRTSNNTPEDKVCEELGIEMRWGLGKKIQSSSELVEKARNEQDKVKEIS